MSEQEIKITEISFNPAKPTPKGLVCYVSFTLDNKWRIQECAIYTRPNNPEEYRISYPIKKIGLNKTVQTVYPISKEIGLFIEQRLIAAYRDFKKEK